MRRDELIKMLDEAPVLTKLPDVESTSAFEELLKHPGLPLLWGLLLGSKQAHFAALSAAPLGNLEEVRRAGVLQGTIRGIDMIYQTLVEQSVPSQMDDTQEQTHG